MPITGTNSRPSTAPISSGTFFGGGTGSVADAAHHPRNTSAKAANTLPQTPPASSGCPLAAGGQPEIRMLCALRLRCDGRRSRSPTNLASVQNRPEGFTEPDSGTPCSRRSESVGRRPANGAQAGPGLQGQLDPSQARPSPVRRVFSPCSPKFLSVQRTHGFRRCAAVPSGTARPC